MLICAAEPKRFLFVTANPNGTCIFLCDLQIGGGNLHGNKNEDLLFSGTGLQSSIIIITPQHSSHVQHQDCTSTWEGWSVMRWLHQFRHDRAWRACMWWRTHQGSVQPSRAAHQHTHQINVETRRAGNTFNNYRRNIHDGNTFLIQRSGIAKTTN